MAVVLPIVSEFDARGIKRAIAQFKQLETTGEKAQFAIKKAAVPAAAALTGLAVALGSATQAAMEDQQEQAMLAKTLKNVTNATDAQIKSVEEQITKMSRASGIADTDYRRALEALTRGTKDVSKSMKDMNLVMDISTALQIDSATVADALAKAYQGNYKALQKLSPELKTMIGDGASLNDVMGVLGTTFGGTTAANAETAAGKMAIFNNSIAEAKESIGAALLPVLEELLPYLQDMADWAGKNTSTIVVLIATVGGLATAVLAANATLKVYEATNALVKAANYALGDSFAYASNKIGPGNFTAGLGIAILTLTSFYDLAKDKEAFDALKLSFREAGQAAVSVGAFIANQLLNIVATLNNAIVKMVNDAITGINRISPFKDIPKQQYAPMNVIPQPSFFYTPPTSPNKGLAIPAMANGGIVSSPTLALIGEAGPEAVVPLDKMRGMGGNITINIQGGLGTSTDIANAVYENLRFYNQNVGPLRIRTA